MADISGNKLVLVSGYYGFGNLGDEAILEELTNELKKLVSPEQIVVLSNAPEQTSKIFGVQSINRWKLADFISLLPRTELFISGGGGLFQDATGVKSAIYYGTQIMLARSFGRKVCIYAQGIGPLRHIVSTTAARLSIGSATHVMVRDQDSHKLLNSWQINNMLTADPVWCLEPTEIPPAVLEQLNLLRSKPGLNVGLSLRPSHNFSEKQLENFISVMDRSLPLGSKVLLLPLQTNQDLQPLNAFAQAWRQKDRPVELLKTDQIERPSQWLAILGELDLMVGMRLHALIMALKSGVPAIGLAYDPKVRHVLTQFAQPILNLANTAGGGGTFKEWLPTAQSAIASRTDLAARARQEAENAKKMACQNFELLAKILIHAK